MTVSVRVRHEASDSCALTARDPALVDPTALQAVGWCQQRVVVTGMQPGFAEPPAERIDGVFVDCENARDRYVVETPSDWSANAEATIGACGLFSPIPPPVAGGPSVDNSTSQLTLLDAALLASLSGPTMSRGNRWCGVSGASAATRSDSATARSSIATSSASEARVTQVRPSSRPRPTRTPGDYDTNKATLDVMVRNFD